jgi:phospholipase C
MIHRPLLEPQFDSNFRTFDRFAKDCEKGDLPEYTFIEPRLFFDHNDMHPPVHDNPHVNSSILSGELLLNDIYTSVLNSPLWERTLLVVVFDEHGGCYDHVSPPVGAIPPEENPDYPLQDGFQFDRFGVRVPALFISPYVEAGTVIRSDRKFPFDHTSMIKTICDRWNIDGLKARDMHADTPNIAPVLSRETPRTDTPHFTPRPYKRAPEEHALESPISHLQRAMIVMATHVAQVTAPEFRTIGHAIQFFRKHF